MGFKCLNAAIPPCCSRKERLPVVILVSAAFLLPLPQQVPQGINTSTSVWWKFSKIQQLRDKYENKREKGKTSQLKTGRSKCKLKLKCSALLWGFCAASLRAGWRRAPGWQLREPRWEGWFPQPVCYQAAGGSGCWWKPGLKLNLTSEKTMVLTQILLDSHHPLTLHSRLALSHLSSHSLCSVAFRHGDSHLQSVM